MTPAMIAAEIRKRSEGVVTELVRRKRLDPTVYEKVVTALSQMEATESTYDHNPSSGTGV